MNGDEHLEHNMSIDRFSSEEVKNLERISFEEIRPNILKAIYSAEKSGHPAGSFSIVEIVVVLYEKILRIERNHAEDNLFRDIFILGCGHNGPALYSMLGRKGFFDLQTFIDQYRKIGMFSGHPKVNVPGVEISTGSLGNALSTAVEWASLLQKKTRQDETRPIVYFLDGNAGFEEGITHEAFQNAAQRKIDNLVYIINDNRFTLDGSCNYPFTYSEILSSYGFHVLGKSIEHPAFLRDIEDACDPGHALFKNGRVDFCINGNDIESVWKTLIHAKRIICSGENQGPLAIIFNTVKGYGHERMAGDNSFHAKVPGLTVERGIEGICKPCDYKEIRQSARKGKRITKKIGQIVAELATEYPDLHVLSADTGSSTGVIQIQDIAPDHYIDMGCREQHLVLGALGYERCGKPVLACTFSQYLSSRAREQIITVAQHFRLCRPMAPVILLGTHTGISSGKDDMSHHCIDLYSLAAIPELNLMHAADVEQLKQMLRFAMAHPGFYYIAIEKESEILSRQKSRYEFSDGKFKELALQKMRSVGDGDRDFRFGHPLLLKDGRRVIIVTTGLRSYDALDAANILEREGLSVGVVQLPTISPLNGDELIKLFGKYPNLLIVEENCRQGGIGEALVYMLCKLGISARNIKHLYLKSYSYSDSYENLLKSQSLDVATMVKEAIKLAARSGVLFTPYKNKCMRMIAVPIDSAGSLPVIHEIIDSSFEVLPLISTTHRTINVTPINKVGVLTEA